MHRCNQPVNKTTQPKPPSPAARKTLGDVRCGTLTRFLTPPCAKPCVGADAGRRVSVLACACLHRIPYPTTVREMEKSCGLGSPYPGPDHPQKLITSRRSLVAHAYRVWSTSVSAFVSYPAHKMADRQNRTIALLCQPWRSNNITCIYN